MPELPIMRVISMIDEMMTLLESDDKSKAPTRSTSTHNNEPKTTLLD